MPNKYKLTNDTVSFFGITLYRIEALADFGNVKKGDKGGFVQAEYNLSHEGFCWIYDDAKVMAHARVLDNSKVEHMAWVLGFAIICERAVVRDNAVVSGYALVDDYATVMEKAKVEGESRVTTYATIRGTHVVKGKTLVKGSTSIGGKMATQPVRVEYPTEVLWAFEKKAYCPNCGDSVEHLPGGDGWVSKYKCNKCSYHYSRFNGSNGNRSYLHGIPNKERYDNASFGERLAVKTKKYLIR